MSPVRSQDLPPATSTDAGVAAATAVGLVAWNNLVAAHPWHARHYAFANLVGTAVLLRLAHLRGVPAHELGLSRRGAAAGARAGAAVAAPVIAVWAAGVASPGRRRLRDARLAGMSARSVAYQAVVRVPIGTVVWEETAFRAVLPALLRRAVPPRTARAVNALVFGLWHVRPTLEALQVNGLPASPVRRGAAVTGAIAAGALVDVLFTHLVRSSGSLLAPALVHAASNSGGTVAAALAWRSHPE